MLDKDFFFLFCLSIVSTIGLLLSYRRASKSKKNASAFFLFGIGVFLVTRLLHDAEVSMGFAFGLFAIFSMLRYRTEAIDITDMTYLFLVIAIALITAISGISYVSILLINSVIILSSLIIESKRLFNTFEEKVIEYEVIQNIKPENSEQLLTDLKQRTGLDIVNIDIMTINFLRDTAMIKLQYRPQ